MENILRFTISCIFIVSIVYPVSASDVASFEALIERIARVEERDRVQQNEINRLEDRDQIQLMRIEHLEERDRLQKDEIDLLTERVQTQEDEIKDIRQLLVQKRSTPQFPDMLTRHMEAHKTKRRVPKNKLVNEIEDTSYDRIQRKIF